MSYLHKNIPALEVLSYCCNHQKEVSSSLLELDPTPSYSVLDNASEQANCTTDHCILGLAHSFLRCSVVFMYVDWLVAIDTILGFLVYLSYVALFFSAFNV